MKILIITMSFGASGGMRVITNLANLWTQSGNEVDILAVYKSTPYFPISNNIRIIDFGSDNHIESRSKASKYISMNYDKYDSLISTYWVTAYILKRALKTYIKCYYYIQAYEPDFFDGKTITQLIKRNLARKSYTFSIKKIVNSTLYTNYKSIHTNMVVYPGLDLKLYYSKDINLFNNIIRIGTIGRTEEWKGTSDVCKAMELLKTENIDFEFYIAFNDYDTIPHHFVRPDGDENLSAFYRDMDIVVAACKGQHGAIHYPVIETMAVGTTIVCTDYYPSNDNNAYKVEESAPEQIAQVIKHIINNKDEAIRKREQALKDVQQFDWPIVAKKFLDYLQEGSNIT